MSEHLPQKKDSQLNDWNSFFQFFNERPMRNILESIDQFFQNSNLRPGFKVNIQEESDKYIIFAELPGIKKEQIDIQILQNSVTISINQSEYESYQDENVHIFSKRQSFRNISRTIPMYHQIQVQKAKASYRNGLLKIILQKKSEKKIPLED